MCILAVLNAVIVYLQSQNEIFNQNFVKMSYIGPQDQVAPTLVKSLYWGLEHMKHTIHTKLNSNACILTVNMITKNYHMKKKKKTICRSNK